MKRRDFMKNLSFLLLGGGTYVFLRPTSFVSAPPPKKIFLPQEELKKMGRLYLGDEYILVKEKEFFLVFSRRCPHLGCKLNYDPERELIVCPCHQSKFTLQGKFISGPAKKDLRPLSATLKESGLQIEI